MDPATSVNFAEYELHLARWPEFLAAVTASTREAEFQRIWRFAGHVSVEQFDRMRKTGTFRAFAICSEFCGGPRCGGPDGADMASVWAGVPPIRRKKFSTRLIRRMNAARAALFPDDPDSIKRSRDCGYVRCVSQPSELDVYRRRVREAETLDELRGIGLMDVVGLQRKQRAWHNMARYAMRCAAIWRERGRNGRIVTADAAADVCCTGSGGSDDGECGDDCDEGDGLGFELGMEHGYSTWLAVIEGMHNESDEAARRRAWEEPAVRELCRQNEMALRGFARCCAEGPE
jgi:hypothetical protein